MSAITVMLTEWDARIENAQREQRLADMDGSREIGGADEIRLMKKMRDEVRRALVADRG